MSTGQMLRGIQQISIGKGSHPSLVLVAHLGPVDMRGEGLGRLSEHYAVNEEAMARLRTR
jgi:hypothetical protein